MSSSDSWLVHEHSLLVTHLKRHMALAEEVLYPACESTLHAPLGPTTTLREEHDNIVRLIQGMAQIFKASARNMRSRLWRSLFSL